MSLFSSDAYSGRLNRPRLYILVPSLLILPPGLGAAADLSSEAATAGAVVTSGGDATATAAATVVAGQSYTYSLKATCTRFGQPVYEPATLAATAIPSTSSINITISPNPVQTYTATTATLTTQVATTPQIYTIHNTGSTPTCGTLNPYDFQLTVTAPPSPPSVELVSRTLTTAQLSGTPAGGSFGYVANILQGRTIASIGFAPGNTPTSNPNTAQLSNPANPSTSGKPSPGGLAKITASYGVGDQSATTSFNAATFGLSCYYTTSEEEWGTPPKKCRTIKIKGITYSGIAKETYGLAGTYCSSFIAEVKIQGSGVTAAGAKVQYIKPATGAAVIKKVKAINGADNSPVVPGKTIARDPSIIPRGKVLVDINLIGDGLLANDTGGDIIEYRIDLYKGLGPNVCKSFNNIMAVSACRPANPKCPGENS